MSLAIQGVGGYDTLYQNTLYPAYNASPVSPVTGADRVMRSDGSPDGKPVRTDQTDGTEAATPGKKVEKGECQTCKNRKYVDGSNENDVSFKTPGHIDPGNAASTVMAHEKEHVANAVAEGSKPNKQLVSATVTLHTSVCPECGRVYVSGGTTHTTMRTTKESSNSKDSSNPYIKLQRDMNRNLLAGMNFDMSA